MATIRHTSWWDSFAGVDPGVVGAGDLVVTSVAAAAVIDLRRAVLRNGRTDLSAALDIDDHDETLHLAAFDRRTGLAGAALACLTLVPHPWAERPDDVRVRLALMAVDPNQQGGGVGSHLLGVAKRAAAHAGTGIWAFARVTALGFYERQGFGLIGDPYVGAMGLPHQNVLWLPPPRSVA